ncbi:MAG: hypothetical protein AB1567_08560 [bacterium]
MEKEFIIKNGKECILRIDVPTSLEELIEKKTRLETQLKNQSKVFQQILDDLQFQIEEIAKWISQIQKVNGNSENSNNI